MAAVKGGMFYKQLNFIYSFANDGGAVSTIGMGVFLPAGAIVQLGVANVFTALTSGGAATIAVGWTGDTGALIAATAVASWSDNAVIEGVDLTVAMVKVTAVQELAVTIATAALTAGEFYYTCNIMVYPQV